MTHLSNLGSGGIPGGAAAAVAQLFGARLALVTSTSINLAALTSSYVAIGQGTEYIDVTTIATLTTLKTLIGATGLNTAAAPAVPVVGTPVRYYAYVSDSQASYAPLELRLSATAPTRDANGTYYLTGANGLHWRFCGYVGIWNDGGGGGGLAEFRDSVTTRGIANYYNRLNLHCLLNPGYTDDNADTTLNITATAYGVSGALVNGGTGDTFEFVGNGEDAPWFHMAGRCDNVNGGSVGIGYDSFQPQVTGYIPGVASNFGLPFTPIAAATADVHKIYMMAVKDTTTMLWYADSRRYGATKDNPTGVLKGIVQG